MEIERVLKDIEKVKQDIKRISENSVVQKPAGFFKEFREFLEEYKIIGLAIAFIMGAAATVFVKAIVDNFIMPLITPFIPGGSWQTATFSIGPVIIGWGALLGAMINFLAIALVVFLIAKLVLREGKVTKK